MSYENEKNENKISLTARQKAIIKLITKFTVGSPVTITTISEKLNLSSRTILREMPIIEKWLRSHNFNFVRKSGVGLILEENLEGYGKILKLLEKETGVAGYSKKERVQHILGEMLASQEPLKALYFTKKYKISEGTLNNDLESIRSWCEKFDIVLIKKQGLGIYLQGDEEDFRQAIGSMIYDICDETEIYRLLRGKSIEENSSEVEQEKNFFNLIDEKTITIVENIISELQEYTKIKYMDRAYIGLVIHISLAVKRIQNKEEIKMSDRNLDELKNSALYEISKKIVKRLEEVFQIAIPKDEIGFITMHLSGANISSESGGKLLIGEEIGIRKELLLMIEKVEIILEVTFQEKENLVDDLFKHAVPMINRLKLKIIPKNSQLDNIQKEYMKVFEAVKKSCQDLKLFKNFSIDAIPDEEVCFMTMYFCVAFENNILKNQMVRVIVACPTGIGTSRMLAMGIGKNFQNIQVVDAVPIGEVSLELLQKNSIEMIISTIELDIDFQNVVVSPVLKTKDKLLIKNAVEKKLISRDDKKYNNSKKLDKKQITYITDLGKEILHLLSEFKLVKLNENSTKEVLNDYISKMFIDDEKISKNILELIKDDSNLSTTYLKDFKISFFNCTLSDIDKSYLGYIDLNETIYGKEKKLSGAIIMLIPKENNIVICELMSVVCKALIEDENLYDYFIHYKTTEIHKKIEEIFVKYYQKISLKRLEC